MAGAFQRTAFQNSGFQTDVIVTPPATGVPQGGTGGGGRGGAKWERVSTSDGARPGQLSVREQNLKELRELQAIERDLKRQKKAATRDSEEAAQIAAELLSIKALIAEARAEAGKVTAMSAAFARAGLLAPSIEPIDTFDEDEEEEIMLLMIATLH